MKRCIICEKVLLGKGLNSRQKKAMHICADCVRAAMNKDELTELLNPKEVEDERE